MTVLDLEALQALPHLGWVHQPAPVTALPQLAQQLGLASLHIKRDDLLEHAHGGTKQRKLNYLLAQPAFAQASSWTSVGALGSGHLAALVAAGQALDKKVVCHVFDEAISPGVLDNLAYTASWAAQLVHHRSRLGVAVRAPALFVAQRHKGHQVVPMGGTCPPAMAGSVAAGLELERQVAAGALPKPDAVYVAWGTGGTAAGLALGLGAAGLRTTVRAVSVVERLFSPKMRAGMLIKGAAAFLAQAGLVPPAGTSPVPLEIVRGLVGRGYGYPSGPGEEARAMLLPHGVGLEAVYTAKAFAGLLRDARAGLLKGQHVVFWHTAAGRPPQPVDPQWQQKLSPALAAWARGDKVHGGRRRLLLGAGAGALVASVRLGGYGSAAVGTGPGVVLAGWERAVVAAAAAALVPGCDAAGVAAAVDRYVSALPRLLRLQIHGMLVLVEHGTWLDGSLRRFTRLDAVAQRGFVARLQDLGGLISQAGRGVRDLCLLGHYQRDVTWEKLGYGGPMVAQAPRPPLPEYAALLAPDGAMPKGARHDL